MKTIRADNSTQRSNCPLFPRIVFRWCRCSANNGLEAKLSPLYLSCNSYLGSVFSLSPQTADFMSVKPFDMATSFDMKTTSPREKRESSSGRLAFSNSTEIVNLRDGIFSRSSLRNSTIFLTFAMLRPQTRETMKFVNKQMLNQPDKISQRTFLSILDEKSRNQESACISIALILMLLAIPTTNLQNSQ